MSAIEKLRRAARLPFGGRTPAGSRGHRTGGDVGPRDPNHLRIVHAPCHGPTLTRTHVRHALSLGGDSVGFTEAYNRITYLLLRVVWRLTVGTSKTDQRRGPKDNPIATRRRWARIESGARLACHASDPSKWAPERWLTWSVFRHPVGVVAHLSLHPNAVVRNANQSLDRVQKYALSMWVLRAKVRFFQSRGHLIVVTGDFQWDDDPSAPAYSPGRLFRDLGLRFVRHGIDWVAYDDRLRVVHDVVISRAANGQDHVWIVVDLEPRGIR